MNRFCNNQDGASTRIGLSDEFMPKGVTPFLFVRVSFCLNQAAAKLRHAAVHPLDYQLQSPFT
jgi:hypothetical protein